MINTSTARKSESGARKSGLVGPGGEVRMDVRMCDDDISLGQEGSVQLFGHMKLVIIAVSRILLRSAFLEWQAWIYWMDLGYESITDLARPNN